jgi:hypothetical protein
MKYRFITYNFEQNNGMLGWGNCDVAGVVLRNMGDVQKLQKDIAREYGYKNVVILDWRNYDK